MRVIVYTDAAANTVTRTINRFGKQAKSTNGYRIGLVCEAKTARRVITTVSDSFAAETWGLLKALEFALDCHPDATEVEIRSDCQQAGQITRHEQANGFVRAMDTLARNRGVSIVHAFVAGRDNPADRISRTEEDPTPALQSTAEAVATQLTEQRKVTEMDLLPEEIQAYIDIQNSARSANGRRKHFVALRDRVAARLGVDAQTCDARGLGHLLQQSAVRASIAVPQPKKTA